MQAGPEVADAHGRGDGVAVNFTEGLHLEAAGQGGQAVGQQIPRLGLEGHEDQHPDLDQHADLPPVQADLPALEMLPDEKGQGDARAEGQHGAAVLLDHAPVALGEVHAEEQDVARLGVGKDLAAEQVGVGVHEAPGEGQQQAQADGLGDLPVLAQLGKEFFVGRMMMRHWF